MSDFEVRAQALRAAAQVATGKSWGQQDILRLAAEFEKWIKTGRISEERRY